MAKKIKTEKGEEMKIYVRPSKKLIMVEMAKKEGFENSMSAFVNMCIDKLMRSKGGV